MAKPPSQIIVKLKVKPRSKSSFLKLNKLQKKPGHFAGKFWIWGDKKKTHISFLRMSIRTRRPLPPGFYKFCSDSEDPGVIKMGKVAKALKIKEMK